MRVPQLLLGKDIDDFRTKAGIEYAVLDILRRHGIVSAPPKRRSPRLRLVKDEQDS
jgi:hypothetical protein